MRHPSRRNDTGTLLFLMLFTLGCGLLLGGCGARLPDDLEEFVVSTGQSGPFAKRP